MSANSLVPTIMVEMRSGSALSHSAASTEITCVQYGPERNNSRPGGNMTTVPIQSTFWRNVSTVVRRDNSSSSPAIYPFNLVGDEDSVRAVLDVLVSSDCDVANLTIVPYSSTNTSQPRPENVVQYYRTSSFALTLNGYNNTAELPSNMPPNNSTAPPSTPDTPLPTNHTDLNFLACINSTIEESLPIMDSAAAVKVLPYQLGGLLGLLWMSIFLMGGGL